MEVRTVPREPSQRDIPQIVRPTAPDESSVTRGPELTRYDLLLAMIPTALLAAWIAGHVAAIPGWLALGVGALVVVPVLVDGVVLNPPA